eukprot:g15699.t1
MTSLSAMSEGDEEWGGGDHDAREAADRIPAADKIRAVQDEIRGLESTIKDAEKETKKVAKKIDDIEAAIAGGSRYLGMTDPEALLKQLGRKEDEKEQLRREKEQLRELLLKKEDRLSRIEQLRANNAPAADKSLTEFAAALTEAVVTDNTLELANGTVFPGARLKEMSTRSGGQGAAGSGDVDLQDLEERLGNRLDNAVEQRISEMTQQMTQQLSQQLIERMSSMMREATAGGGESRESGGAGGAAGGSQSVPGAQVGAPAAGATEGSEGSQVGWQEGGETVPSIAGGGDDMSGRGAVGFSTMKQFPRIQTPQFKGDRKFFLSFRADFIRTAEILDIVEQFVGTSRVADITKSSRELINDGFSSDEISAGKNAWNLLFTALQSEHSRAIIRQCPNAKVALQELDAVYSPDTQGAKQELFRRFNGFRFSAKDDPVRALNDLELIWSQLNAKDGVVLDMSFLLTKFIDILPTPEYEAAQNSLGAMREPTREDVVRIVTTHREKIVRLGDEEKGAMKKGLEHAYTATENGRGGGKKGGGGGRNKERVRCYRCNRFGHYRSDCTTDPKDFLTHCGRCRGVGHTKDQCPTKEEEEKKVVEQVNIAVVDQSSDVDSLENQAF